MWKNVAMAIFFHLAQNRLSLNVSVQRILFVMSREKQFVP